jgi:hypothetical protein
MQLRHSSDSFRTFFADSSSRNPHLIVSIDIRLYFDWVLTTVMSSVKIPKSEKHYNCPSKTSLQYWNRSKHPQGWDPAVRESHKGNQGNYDRNEIDKQGNDAFCEELSNY